MGTTYKEIAEAYGRSRSTVVNVWARHEDWPAPVGKRGRALEFDQAAVASFVASHVKAPAPVIEGDDDELVDVEEMSAMTGYEPLSLWSMVGHGRWPKPAGKRRKRDARGVPMRSWVSLWRLGDVRAELERRGGRR